MKENGNKKPLDFKTILLPGILIVLVASVISNMQREEFDILRTVVTVAVGVILYLAVMMPIYYFANKRKTNK